MREHYHDHGDPKAETTYSTLSSNGQLQPVFERTGIMPPRYAAQTTFIGQGTGRGPSVPGGVGAYPGYGLGYGGGSSGSLSMSSGNGGPANMDASDAAAADPFNPTASPVLWACVFLLVGMLGLRYVHWRG